MNKIRVLFLCTSNSARSQMAEAFLRHHAGEIYEAYSAGIDPRPIHPLTRKVMDEVGIDISKQYPKALKDYMGKIHFGYLITVCTEAEKQCPTTFPGMGQRLHWNIEDPAAFKGTEEEKLKKFREIRDIVEKKVLDWLKSQNK
ncbi:MAG TPA: arsenate reductase ArsC [Dehalococcoidales bacterium]|nr:arsenate reductase ArsC [Dehalococcoidales bacterium]